MIDDSEETWVGVTEAAELIGCSRQYISQQISQLKTILDGVQVRRGRRLVWRFRRERCVYFGCVYFGAARERYLVQRANARADMHCAVQPTDSDKEPRRGR